MPRTSQENPDVAEPVAAMTDEQRAFLDAQAAEYGQWVAKDRIYHGVALAYLPGDPVPASNVAAHKYDEAGLVEKVK